MDIDPNRLYSFAAARWLIPSVRDGKVLSITTLHRWRAAGLVRAVCRPVGRQQHWFIPGSEILRLSTVDQAELPAARSPAERRRDVEAARRRFEELTQCGGAKRAGSNGAAGRRGSGSG